MTERERLEANIRAILRMAGVIEEPKAEEEPKKPAKKQTKKEKK